MNYSNLKEHQPKINIYIYIAIIGLYFFTVNIEIPVLRLVLSTTGWSLLQWYDTNSSSWNEALLKNLILSIPLSFISVMGTRDFVFFNWYNIFLSLSVFSLTISTFKDKSYGLREKPLYVKFLLLSLICLSLSLLANLDLISIKIFALTTLYLLHLLLVFVNLHRFNKSIIDFVKVYDSMIFLIAIFVFLQFVLNNSFNLTLGRIQVYGKNRIAYGFLYFDYSFLSLILVSGIFRDYFKIKGDTKINYAAVISVFIKIIAALITSARTGVAALIIVYTLYYIFRIARKVINKKLFKRDILTLFVFVSIVLLLLCYILKTRGFGGSGRSSLNYEALKDFLDKPLFGNGLSFPVGKMKPHNLFTQTLSQTGIVFTLPFLIFNISFLKDMFKKNHKVVLSFLIILMGSMFIPDIIISRFYTISVIIVIIEAERMFNDKRPKIGHVLNSGGYSGAEKITISIIENSPKDMSSIYVSPPGVIDNILEEKSIKKATYQGIIEFLSVVRANEIDIVYAHDFKSSVYAALFFPNLITISHIHQNPPWLGKVNVNSILFLLASFLNSKIVYVSQSTAESFVFKKLIKSKTIVMDNYVDYEEIKKLSSNTQNLKKYDLIYCGRLEDVKNPIEFLKIFKELRKNHSALSAVICGDGSLMNQVKLYIEDNNLEGMIDLIGYQENPFQYIKQSKIMVVTSIWEGFGLSAVESMLLSVPVVAREVGGLRDIIEEGSGYLCETRQEFIRSIDMLLTSPNLYRTTSDSAFERAQKFVNVNKWRNQIASIVRTTDEKRGNTI